MSKSNRADFLLNDEFFNSLLHDLELKIFRDWKHAKTTDERESLHFQLKGIDSIRNRLKSMASAQE